jgi:hypothetical protein
MWSRDGAEFTNRLLTDLLGPAAVPVSLSDKSSLKIWIEKYRKRRTPEPVLSLAMVGLGCLETIGNASDLYCRSQMLPSTQHDPDLWLRYYREPLEAVFDLGKQLSGDTEISDAIDLMRLILLHRSRQHPDRYISFAARYPSLARRSLVVAIEDARRRPLLTQRMGKQMPRFLASLTNRLAALAVNQFDTIATANDDVAKITDSPALLFLVQVLAPCVLFEGQMPHVLWRRAMEQNDRKALQFLLKLDHRLRDIPPMAECIRNAVRQQDQSILSVFAADRSRPKRWEWRDAASLLAILLIEMSSSFRAVAELSTVNRKQLPRRLSANDLRGLLDAYRRDVTQDRTLMEDRLPESLEAWDKSISRLRTTLQWTDIFAPGSVEIPLAG